MLRDRASPIIAHGGAGDNPFARKQVAGSPDERSEIRGRPLRMSPAFRFAHAGYYLSQVLAREFLTGVAELGETFGQIIAQQRMPRR